MLEALRVQRVEGRVVERAPPFVGDRPGGERSPRAPAPSGCAVGGAGLQDKNVRPDDVAKLWSVVNRDDVTTRYTKAVAQA